MNQVPPNYYGNLGSGVITQTTTGYAGEGSVPTPDTLGGKFSRLTELVQHLRHVSSELQQRLTPVLSAPPPQPATNKVSPISNHAPMVQAMDEQLDLLAMTIDELANVTSRTRL